ncbi:MAG: hypothetical protein AAGB29_00260 [Planctomycetota bacterium]
MTDARPDSRLIAALPGWMMLIGGLALVATSVVVPPLHAAAAMQRQRETLAAHVATRDAQLDRLRQLADALDDDDPALLARVAHDRWGMTPDRPDTTLLDPPTPDRPLALAGLELTPAPVAYAKPDTALTRLTHGPYRAALPILGVVFAAAGIAYPWRACHAAANA